MKKIAILVFIVMMMAAFTAAQADVRAGGLPELTFDKNIKDCGTCCSKSTVVRAGGLPEIIYDKRIKDCGTCCSKSTVVRAGGLPEIIYDKYISDCGTNKRPVAVVKGKTAIALNVEFDTGKAIVKEKYYDNIKKVADFMKANPGAAITIEGHTDNVGNAAYNKKLSLKRAKSVRQYMIDKFGIDGKRIKTAGYGKDAPIANNNTEEGRQKNRRVEAVVEVKK
jgi:outer membrane protein OmpA-like peptidoglycan-associated protein